MGEVFRAEDINLFRHVAIKVLPDIFAGDPERLARFEREARALVALSQTELCEQYHGKAFELRDRAGEREKLYIIQQHYPATGQTDICD